MRRVYLIILVSLVIVSCQESTSDIAPVEVRTSEAIAGLRAELTAPANGWKIAYRPTDGAGIFFMLLKFTEDGNVNIQSDIPDNNGEFYNETITYRLDSGLGLELIFETYAVFHYLFELDQASFGGEFQFKYKEKVGENLIFESKSDVSDPTVLTFEPAAAGDENTFAREIAENLSKFKTDHPQIFGGINPRQQIILNDKNMSFFWSIDLVKRNLTAEFAANGTTDAEVIANGVVTINKSTGYTFGNGKLILEEPFSFVLSNQKITISELAFTTFSLTAPDLCATSVATDQPKYEGQISGLGSITLVNTLLSTSGAGFQDNLYSVNAQFIFDDQGRSLLDEGSIHDKFPDAGGFLFVYNTQLNDPNIPINSVGFTFTNPADNSSYLYMREFQATQTEINRIQITLLDNYYYSVTPPAGTEQDLKDVTDEIFGDGQFYAFDYPITGATVYRLYNPCNNYEIFLVQ